MKKQKNIRKSAALVLSFSLLLGLLLSGCDMLSSGGKAAPAKDWDTTIDITDAFNDALKDALEDDSFKIKDFTIDVTVSVNDNGEYELTVDEKRLERTLDDVFSSLIRGSDSPAPAPSRPAESAPPAASRPAEGSLVGTWAGPYDLTQQLLSSISQGMDEKVMDYFSDIKFSVDMTLKLRSDGTFQMSLDRNSVERAFDRLISDVERALLKFLQDYVKENAPGMTVEEYLEANGASLEEFYEQIESRLPSLDGMTLEQSGTYEADERTISLEGQSTLQYRLSGNTLTITDENDVTIVLARK